MREVTKTAMPTVGRLLAAERIRQGLTLDRVSGVTKITTRTLRAIEADDFEQLPGLVFARNFVGQYARALTLDPAAAVAQFNREQSMAEADGGTSGKQRQIHVPNMSGSVFAGLAGGNTLSAFFKLVLTLAVCAGMFYAFEYMRTRNASKASVVRSVKPPAQTKRPVPAKVPPPSPMPVELATPISSTPQPAEPEIASVRSSVHVGVKASETCWARVTTDGRVLFAGTLAPGDARTFDASDNITIRAGNAGALAIQLNGNDVPPIGPEGQIRTVTLTAAGAQVRTPTPEPVLDF